MKELLTTNIADFVSMDPQETVSLCDQWFDRDYIAIADSLQTREQSTLAFSFLNTVLVKHEAEILAEHENFFNYNQAISEKTKQLLLRVVEILSDKKVKNFDVVDYVTRSYFPVEECLLICERNGAIEACAVLYRRKGQYNKSIKLYM